MLLRSGYANPSKDILWGTDNRINGYDTRKAVFRRDFDRKIIDEIMMSPPISIRPCRTICGKASPKPIMPNSWTSFLYIDGERKKSVTFNLVSMPCLIFLVLHFHDHATFENRFHHLLHLKLKFLLQFLITILKFYS